MKVEILYTYIVRGSEPENPVNFQIAHQRFVDTYRAFKPSIPHVLRAVCYNGERDEPAERVFSGLNVEWSYYNGSGFDLGAYQAVGGTLDSDFVVCFNSQIHFHRSGWLERFVTAFERHGEGVYGAMGSFENSPHLRGPCMAMPPKLLRQYPHRIDSRESAHRAESGDRNLTQWVISQGKPALMVTWDQALEQKDWRKPRGIFRRDNQENCIVWDRHTKYWEDAPPEEKAALARSADGLNPPSRPIATASNKTITVVAVTSLAPQSHAEAIHRTAACIPYPVKKLLISPAPPKDPKGIRCVSIPKWMPGGKWSLSDMCRFLLKDLHEHIDTDVAILVQWDGYAVHPWNWTDRFLDYDYIGAPWPIRFPFLRWHRNRRVGNGGFSIRSRKWLKACANLSELPAKTAEDVYVSVVKPDHFARLGCRVAPLDLAMKWSVEHIVEEYPNWKLTDSFGFHGLTQADPARKHLQLSPGN